MDDDGWQRGLFDYAASSAVKPMAAVDSVDLDEAFRIERIPIARLLVSRSIAYGAWIGVWSLGIFTSEHLTGLWAFSIGASIGMIIACGSVAAGVAADYELKRPISSRYGIPYVIGLDRAQRRRFLVRGIDAGLIAMLLSVARSLSDDADLQSESATGFTVRLPGRPGRRWFRCDLRVETESVEEGKIVTIEARLTEPFAFCDAGRLLIMAEEFQRRAKDFIETGAPLELYQWK